MRQSAKQMIVTRPDIQWLQQDVREAINLERTERLVLTDPSVQTSYRMFDHAYVPRRIP